MRKFHSILFAAVSLLSFNAFCADDGWYLVTNSKDGNDEYSVKFGSGNPGKNKQNESMTVVVGKIFHKKENSTDIQKWYVTDVDCANEYGKLVVLDVDGTFKFDAPYAKGSKTIGSAIAELICAAGDSQKKKESEGKGI